MAITGTRPKRSMARRPEARTGRRRRGDRGPRPSSDLKPVTSTKVRESTAAASRRTRHRRPEPPRGEPCSSGCSDLRARAPAIVGLPGCDSVCSRPLSHRPARRRPPGRVRAWRKRSGDHPGLDPARRDRTPHGRCGAGRRRGPGRGCVLQVGERPRRRSRAADPVPLRGRRVQPGRDGTQDGSSSGRGRVRDLQQRWNRARSRRAPVSQHRGRSAALRGRRALGARARAQASRGRWDTCPVSPAKGRCATRYLARTRPRAKIAVLHEDSAYSEDMFAGLRRGLGRLSTRIRAVQTTTCPTRISTHKITRA